MHKWVFSSCLFYNRWLHTPVHSLWRLNAKYQPPSFGYGFKPNLFTPNNADSLQLVPYAQPEATVNNQKVPLTPDKLDSLYKMNYAVQPYSANVNPNMYSYNMPRPVAPPPIFYPGISVPVAFTPNHQTLQQQQPPIESNNGTIYNPSIAGASYSSASSNTPQQYFQQNVINPQSALVPVPKVYSSTVNGFSFYLKFLFISCSCHLSKI